MTFCLLEHDALRTTVIRRLVQAMGHTVLEGVAPEGGNGGGLAANATPSLVFADLTDGERRPAARLRSLHQGFPEAVSIVLLRIDQTVTAEEALDSGVQAVLREPLRLEDLELHLNICANRIRRKTAAATGDQGA